MSEFGGLKRLVALRKAKGVTQQALADDIFSTQSAIDSYEKGRYQPDIEMLKAMANYFEVSVDYLIGNVDVSTPITQVSVYELSRSEVTLIEKFRQLSETAQEHLVGFFAELQK